MGRTTYILIELAAALAIPGGLIAFFAYQVHQHRKQRAANQQHLAQIREACEQAAEETKGPHPALCRQPNRTADGVTIGRCLLHVHGGSCPRHGPQNY